jgi:hypothetical protein
MQTNITSEIDRHSASKILGVSVRTIDRYIRSGKLFSWTDNRRIWLDKEQILNFPRGQSVNITKPVMSRQITKSTVPIRKQEDSSFYKDLYEDAKQALKDYQQKLEQSNYRIGQLESRANLSVGRPITHYERHDDQITTELIRRDLDGKEKELQATKALLKQEQTSRVVLTVLLYVLIGLLPLVWFLVR